MLFYYGSQKGQILNKIENKFFEDFLIFKSDNDNISDRTFKAYSDVLVRFEAWLSGRDPLSVTSEDLLVFTGPYLFKALSLAPTSRTPYIATIRQLYQYLCDARRLIKNNPALAVPYPRKAQTIPNVISLSNAQKMMWAPDFTRFEGVRDAAIIALLIGCGLRVSGLISLNDSNIIRMDIEGEPRLALKPTEKGGKERLIPIPREADLLLRVYLEHPALLEIVRETTEGEQVLFVTVRNRHCPSHEYYGEKRRFSSRGLYSMLVRYGKKLGIPKDQLNPHAMRHLYGTELAEENVDLITRQKLMGHADPKSTAIYTHMAARKLTREVDKANPLSKMSTPVSQLLSELVSKPHKAP